MDRHVRWFRREIAVSVAQRLAAETVAAGLVALIIGLLVGAGPLTAIVSAALAIPMFIVLRIALALMSNPMTSVYLMRWPHPSGEVNAVEQNNVGSTTDTALKGYQFAARGALDEWGGAVTNVYTRGSNQIIVTTTDDDDLVVLSKLDDERLVITTKQLIPPHEQLIVNRQLSADVRAALASHVELVKNLTASGHNVVIVGVDELIELLAIEWDAWDQIGPVIGPFVSIGQRRQPSLLQATVPPLEILRRTGTPEPRIKAKRTSVPPSITSARAGELATPAAVHPVAPAQPSLAPVEQVHYSAPTPATAPSPAPEPAPAPGLVPPPIPQVPPVEMISPPVQPAVEILAVDPTERAAS